MELMRRETDNYKKARPVFLHPLLFSILRLQRSEMKLKLIYHDDEPFTYYISQIAQVNDLLKLGLHCLFLCNSSFFTTKSIIFLCSVNASLILTYCMQNLLAIFLPQSRDQNTTHTHTTAEKSPILRRFQRAGHTTHVTGKLIFCRISAVQNGP